MTYDEALQILFNELGRRATFLWMDINNISKEEAIQEALKYKH